MSEKCLYCQTPIEQKEGKRERKFCTPSHCTMYHLKNKNKDKPKGQRGRPVGVKNKVRNIEGFETATHTYPPFEVKPQSEWGSEMNANTFTHEIAGMVGGNKVVSDAINELLTFGTTTVKTELVEGKVKQSVVDKKQIVSAKMPEGLDWRQQLEWKRNNKKQP